MMLTKDDAEKRAEALKHRLGPWRDGAGGESAGCLRRGCAFAALQGHSGYFLTSEKACAAGKRLAGAVR